MTITLDTPVLAPTAKRERYVVMDALRGFALLGVMTINLYEFGGLDVLITAEQLAALPSAALDGKLQFWLNLLIYDRANTLFAFLFAQMELLRSVLHAVATPLVMAVFTVQIVVSNFWIKVFAFGPAEWLWRALTYKNIPAMRRTRAAPA